VVEAVSVIVNDIRLRKEEGRQRLEATLVYEDCGRPPVTAWISTDAEPGPALSLTSDPFFIAGVILSAFHRERRLRVDGPPPCPELVENAPIWIHCLAARSLALPLPRIESSADRPSSEASADRTVAGYLSGGVDSLAMFHHHLRQMPEDHPWRIREALCIFGLYGFDCPGGIPDSNRFGVWMRLRDRMVRLLAPHGIPVECLRTNFRSLIDDYPTWVELWPFFHTAVIHACPSRWRMAWIASGAHGVFGPDGAYASPFSTFVSGRVRMESHGMQELRLDRVRQLTDWPEALAVVQPCHGVDILPPGQINCNRCIKCILARLQFAACGALDRATAFPPAPLTPADVDAIHITNPEVARRRFGSLLEPLEREGRRDLAEALRRRMPTGAATAPASAPLPGRPAR
jgi:hypothetical protein